MFCPVCHRLGAHSFLMSLDYSTPYRVVGNPQVRSPEKCLVRCEGCGANYSSKISHVDVLEDKAAQALVNYDFYRQEFDTKKFDQELDVYANILKAFDRFIRCRDAYVEIGIGLGMLSRAAGRNFGTVVGLDLEVETARAVGPIPENVKFIVHGDYSLAASAVDAVDAIAAWHVLEHLPEPHRVLAPLFRDLRTDGVFFGQIPLLREDYVIEAHYVFYDESVLCKLMAPYGLHPIYFERDETNDFLSFCFRKHV